MIKDKKIDVLDKGFVKVVDVMGDDNAIVQSARVSYNQGSKGDVKDKGLINYLMRNGHTSPLEQCIIKLHIKAPLFVVRQWQRHRCWSYNEVSYRYTEPEMEFYKPSQWRGQAKDNKQMSAGVVEEQEIDIHDEYMVSYTELTAIAQTWYNANIKNGMCREQARIALQQSLYTQLYATVDLHNLLHFIKLRMHPHAQYEIRVYAEAIAEFVKEWCPWTWEAFEEHILYSAKLSRKQKRLVLELLKLCHQKQDPDLRQSLENVAHANDLVTSDKEISELLKLLTEKPEGYK